MLAMFKQHDAFIAKLSERLGCDSVLSERFAIGRTASGGPTDKNDESPRPHVVTDDLWCADVLGGASRSAWDCKKEKGGGERHYADMPLDVEPTTQITGRCESRPVALCIELAAVLTLACITVCCVYAPHFAATLLHRPSPLEAALAMWVASVQCTQGPPARAERSPSSY